MKRISSIILTVFIAAAVSVPTSTYSAVKLVFCNETLTNGKFDSECGWPQLVDLMGRFMNFLILLSIPLAVIAVAVAGFKMITSGGSTKARDEAKDIFEKVVIGLFFMLAAWLIVHTILIALVGNSSDYSILGN